MLSIYCLFVLVRDTLGNIGIIVRIDCNQAAFFNSGAVVKTPNRAVLSANGDGHCLQMDMVIGRWA